MRYTDRETQKREENRRDTRHEITLTERHRRREENRRDTRHEIH